MIVELLQHRGVLVLLAGFCVVFELTSSANAQVSSTTSRLTLQGPADQSTTPIIRDALNRPCLDVEAAARKHVVNPEMVDHVVSLKNSCVRLIKVKVCYTNSDRCKDATLEAHRRVDIILGTMHGVSTFRYTMFQK